MRQASLSVLAMILSVATAACEKDRKDGGEAAEPSKGAEPAAGRDQPAAERDDQPSPPPGAPVVKLLSAGSDPKKALRLAPRVGDKQSIVMLMKLEMAMEMGSSKQPAMTLPTTKVKMDITVKEVAENGDIEFEFVMSELDVLEDAGTMPGIAGTMRTALKSVEGTAGPGSVTNRGFNKGIDLELPPGADPLMTQTMSQMTSAMNQVAAPLPEEPIGVGGTWEVHMTLPVQGMILKQVATYELTKLDGGKIEATTSIDQHADPQKVVNPQMPSVNIDLISLRSTGSGALAMDLARIAPSDASANVSSKAEMAVEIGGKKQPMKVDTKIGFTLKGD